MTWVNLKTAALAGVGVWLTVGTATVVAAQAIANGASAQMPPEVRQQLEKQRAAMRAIYLEFTTTLRGTLTNWNYGVAPAHSAYFEGNRFYRREQIPSDERYDNETAFDGQVIWQRARNEVSKCSLADAPGLIRLRSRMWPYLDAASIHAPAYISELERFSSLEPLALHYLERSYSAKVEAVGESLRVTFRVEDELANLQKIEVEKKRSDPQGATTLKGVAAEIEDVKTLKAIKPARTVVLLLDPKYGYGVAEREEWNVAGQRTGRIQSEDWKFYEGAGIWLPSRCLASYYARPTLFLTEISKQPVHIVTIELKRVEFGTRHGDCPADMTSSGEARSRGRKTTQTKYRG